MCHGRTQCQRVALDHQKPHDFGRKRRESCQATQEARDQQQSPHGVQLRHGLKNRNAQPNQIATYQVGGQRAPGNHGTGAEPQTQTPAGQRAS